MNNPITFALCFIFAMYLAHCFGMLPFCPFCLLKVSLTKWYLRKWEQWLDRQEAKDPGAYFIPYQEIKEALKNALENGELS
jgi:hypothetical protein